MTAPSRGVGALPTEWRRLAEDESGCDPNMDPDGYAQRSMKLEQCADDLEAALIPVQARLSAILLEMQKTAETLQEAAFDPYATSVEGGAHARAAAIVLRYKEALGEIQAAIAADQQNSSIVKGT